MKNLRSLLFTTVGLVMLIGCENNSNGNKVLHEGNMGNLNYKFVRRVNGVGNHDIFSYVFFDSSGNEVGKISTTRNKFNHGSYIKENSGVIFLRDGKDYSILNSN